MDRYQGASLLMSAVALMASLATGFVQYQMRQDTVEERLKIEIKMAQNETPLSPSDLRIISGVEERDSLEAAILVTNVGNTSIRLLEVGFHGFDMPVHAFYSGPAEAKNLSPGEQAMFKISDVTKVDRQLTDDIILGEGAKAKIFAITTKGNRFEAPAIIEVAK